MVGLGGGKLQNAAGNRARALHAPPLQKAVGSWARPGSADPRGRPPPGWLRWPRPKAQTMLLGLLSLNLMFGDIL